MYKEGLIFFFNDIFFFLKGGGCPIIYLYFHLNCLIYAWYSYEKTKCHIPNPITKNAKKKNKMESVAGTLSSKHLCYQMMHSE